MLKKLIYLLLPLSLLAQNQTLTFSKGTYQESYRTQETITLDGLTFDLASQKLVAINDSIGIDEEHEEGDGTRFLSIDPLAAKYPSMSPYVFVNNNPNIYIDPDGRENIIYLIVAKDKNGESEIKKTTVEDIIYKANLLLKDNFKVNTRVVLMEAGTIVEKTDNVVTIGNTRSSIQSEMAKFSPGFANSSEINSWVKNNDGSNAEKGNNQISSDQIGGVVDVDDLHKGIMGAAFLYDPKNKAITEQNIKNIDINKFVALIIIHASGHSAKLNHNLVELSAMNEGQSIQKGIRNGSGIENRTIFNFNEKEAWQIRYSSNDASILKIVGRRLVRTKVD
ncbi:MAG: hypothetical protein U0V72_13940 [Cytophagales bacterium]